MSPAEAYEKYKHLDHLLSDKARMCAGDFRMAILFDLWQAVKQAAEEAKHGEENLSE